MAPRRVRAADGPEVILGLGGLGAVFRQPVLQVGRGVLPTFDVRDPLLPDRLRATRAGDLVDVTFRFTNLTLRRDADRLVLQRDDAGKPARLILVLPPQHITEGAIVEVAPTGSAAGNADLNYRQNAPAPADEPLPAPGVAVPTLMAGPSQLVFDVGDTELEFTLAGLLDAARRLPLVVGRNVPTPKDITILQVPATELTIDRARLRRIATQLGLGTATTGRTRARAGRGRGPADTPALPFAATSVESLAQLRASAASLEHRFGREAAATWLVGQLAGQIDEHVIDALVIGPILRRPPRPADPIPAGLTGIELPFRLLLSPHAEGAFENRPALPAGPAVGPTELWHARLGLRTGDDADPVTEAPSRRRTVRAVWARDRDVRGLADLELPNVFERGTEPRPNPFRLSLNSNDRLSITHQTSDFSLQRGRQPWTPPAIPVDRLFLSTLGGWLDGGVSWKTQPTGFELEEWRNIATLGRDHYVRVVRAGFLFPTGHRASFVKVTERKFHPEREGNPAFLRQRFFIVVREPYRVIPTLGDVKQDRRNPFRDIRITTVVTPPLDPPAQLSGIPAAATCFQPMLGGRPFEFQAIVTDPAGNLVEMAVPLLFVGKSANDSSSAVDLVVARFDGADDSKTVPGRTFGQRMAFARPKLAGDTESAVDLVRLAARRRPVGSADSGPRFGPVLASATIAIPALDQLTGASGSVDVTWPQAYLDNDVDGAGNSGQVFLELRTAKTLDFATKKDRSGGLVAPNISIQGLSRAVGPIGVPPAQFAAANLDPAQLFSAALSGAKLFGVVPLAELITAVTGNAATALAQAPKFLTEALTKAAGLLRDAQDLAAALADPTLPGGPALSAVKTGTESVVTQLTAALTAPASANPAAIAAAITSIVTNAGALGTELEAVAFGLRRRILGPLDRIVAIGQDAVALAGDVIAWVQGITSPAGVRTRVAWNPQVKNWPPTGTAIVKFVDPNRALTLAIDLANPPGASAPLVDVSCSIEGVTVDLQVVALKVDLIRFTVRGGQKPDIEVQLADPGGVVFGGPLAFVEGLRSLIPFDGFSDPPSVDIRPDGLRAGFSLALPNLAVGIFSLENLSLSAYLDVPFVGEALSFKFSFCTRENPFRLIVSLFGGGGFVGIELTPKGLRMIEASLEFGAQVALDFGVASGSLSVMAGIYFRYEDGKGVLVSGYFRARGEVDVLGIISASIELTISLTWQEPNKVSGRATLTIEIEVLFFSASVSISCEKRFAGSGADPTFEQIMGPAPDGTDPWREYCEAFVGV